MTAPISLFTDGQLAAENEVELTVLSFGAGQDSTTLLLHYIHDEEFRKRYAENAFITIFADTGNEHPHTYHHLAQVKTLCDEHDIVFVHITPDMGYHGKGWSTLTEQYSLHDSIGSKGYPKTCTSRLKLNPIYSYLEDYIAESYELPRGRKKAFKAFSRIYGKINVLIGIAKGEESRMADPFTAEKDGLWKVLSLENKYPLIDMDMDRQACQEYNSRYFDYEVKPSNCMMCPFTSSQELLWLYRFANNTFEEWCELEENKFKKWEHVGNKNIGVWAKWIKEENRPYSLRDALKDAEARFGHWTDEDLHSYKMNHGCVASKY